MLLTSRSVCKTCDIFALGTLVTKRRSFVLNQQMDAQLPLVQMTRWNHLKLREPRDCELLDPPLTQLYLSTALRIGYAWWGHGGRGLCIAAAGHGCVCAGNLLESGLGNLREALAYS